MVNANEYEPLELSHLHPAAQPVARLPAAERVQRIRADRWIGYPKAVEAVERLETMLGWPAKQRMPNLLLVGPPRPDSSERSARPPCSVPEPAAPARRRPA